MSTSLCSAVTYSTGLGEREAEREREDISCIISCSSTRCLSDLVHDMPPCFSVSSSLALLYLIPSLHPPVSLTDAHFICLPVFPSQLYLFPRMFIRLFSPPCTHGLQLAAEEAHSEPGRACLHAPPRPPSHPGETPDSASPSTPIFDHTVKRECFLLLLDGAFKKPFRSPCLSELHV